MAIDEAVTYKDELTASGVLVIRPTTLGEEWTIHNIYIHYGKKAELYWCDDVTGVDNGALIQPLTMSLCGQYNFHCTNTEFLLLKNVDLTTFDVGYDGVVTRVS